MIHAKMSKRMKCARYEFVLVNLWSHRLYSCLNKAPEIYKYWQTNVFVTNLWSLRNCARMKMCSNENVLVTNCARYEFVLVNLWSYCLYQLPNRHLDIWTVTDRRFRYEFVGVMKMCSNENVLEWKCARMKMCSNENVLEWKCVRMKMCSLRICAR